MERHNNPIQTRRSPVKPIILIIIALIVAFGIYAWRNQQIALDKFQSLKNSGVNVTFSLISRPLLAVDASQSCLYLVDGDKTKQPMRIMLRDINQIIFQEARRSPQKSSDTSTPDSFTIFLKNGEKYRVGDLPGRDSGARQALALFKKHDILTDQLKLTLRD